MIWSLKIIIIIVIIIITFIIICSKLTKLQLYYNFQ